MTATATITEHDRDRLAEFLTVYRSMTDRDKIIVLAFAKGMELQSSIDAYKDG